MDDQGRWLDPLDAERDEEAEHLLDRELARRERLDEKGLPHDPSLPGEPDFDLVSWEDEAA